MSDNTYVDFAHRCAQEGRWEVANYYMLRAVFEALPRPAVELPSSVSTPVKRGPGRPRKTQGGAK